jgi:hypothetical protein
MAWVISSPRVSNPSWDRMPPAWAGSPVRCLASHAPSAEQTSKGEGRLV